MRNPVAWYLGKIHWALDQNHERRLAKRLRETGSILRDGEKVAAWAENMGIEPFHDGYQNLLRYMHGLPSINDPDYKKLTRAEKAALDKKILAG